MQVGVTLPVPVRDHVDRHAVHGDGYIGAVVRIEAAQKDLFGLATTRVLRRHEARHEPQQILGGPDRPVREVERAHTAARSR